MRLPSGRGRLKALADDQRLAVDVQLDRRQPGAADLEHLQHLAAAFLPRAAGVPSAFLLPRPRAAGIMSRRTLAAKSSRIAGRSIVDAGGIARPRAAAVEDLHDLGARDCGIDAKLVGIDHIRPRLRRERLVADVERGVGLGNDRSHFLQRLEAALRVDDALERCAAAFGSVVDVWRCSRRGLTLRRHLTLSGQHDRIRTIRPMRAIRSALASARAAHRA